LLDNGLFEEKPGEREPPETGINTLKTLKSWLTSWRKHFNPRILIGLQLVARVTYKPHTRATHTSHAHEPHTRATHTSHIRTIYLSHTSK